ncbi:MAG: sigma 54-interacting transcriptional regulator [Clostridiales Family XIII bacterium]|jgi:transcriptional regulator with PAS, ATPase and Fis domain|nr:sigma 54-interacting transcriptional regulator [Clostridiales Family XIII bacterium]
MKFNPKLTVEDFQFFLEHVNGFVTIDMEGRCTYINKQICDFCDIDYKTALGKPIKELFSFSKMMDTIEKKQNFTKTEFYFDQGRFSASTRHPMYKDGEMVGVVEYDIFEDMEVIEAFVQHYIDLDEELKYFSKEMNRHLGAKYTIDQIRGNSYAVRDLREKIKIVSRTDSTVMITGETGTGKELVAHSIHNLSKRKLRNFIRINAAAMPESLQESELFGHEPGSFTGAGTKAKKGKFEIADGGTLFIDELSHMPLQLQSKLLRVLQEKEVERIGASKPIPVDARIIVATNKEPQELLSSGELRPDLYYRLNVVELQIPPLRERKDDIPLLVKYYVDEYNNLFGKNVTKIDPRAKKLLTEYDWPGNIRELRNVVEKSMNYIEGETLYAENIDFGLYDVGDLSLKLIECAERPIEECLRRTERALIMQTLEKFDNNKSRAAEYLRITRTLLYQKMKRLGIPI